MVEKAQIWDWVYCGNPYMAATGFQLDTNEVFADVAWRSASWAAVQLESAEGWVPHPEPARSPAQAA